MGRSYLFFPGCSYETAAGYQESAEAVCRALDVKLQDIPEWNCCGATAVFSMDRVQGAWLAARLFALAKTREGREIVTGCNGCLSALKKCQRLLESDPDILSLVNQRLKQEKLGLEPDDVHKLRIRHLLEVFVHDIPEDVWRSKSKHTIKAAPYYGCLYSRPQTEEDNPEHPVLLDRFFRLLGLESVRHSLGTTCCGASHNLPNRDAVQKLVERIIRGIQASGPDAAAVICPLCQFNLDSFQSGLDLPSLPILYFTQVAGLAMGLPGSSLGLNKLLTPYRAGYESK